MRTGTYKSGLHAITLLLLALGATSESAFAADVPQSFTLDGRLYSDTNATAPLLDSSVAFTVQILDESKVCIVYEEAQTASTLASKGYFSIQVGTEVGSPLRTVNDSANSMPTIFQNMAVINGRRVSDGTACTVPASGGKRRFVRIKILPPTMGGVARTLSPDLSIDSVPNAIIAERAESLQGLRANNVLQVNTASGSTLSQSNLESLFTSAARFNSLSAVVDGTSTNYMRSNSASGAQLPSMAGAPTSPTPGSIWYDSSDNKLKYQTSVGPSTLGSGAGTVTSVGFTAPTELSVAGAPISTSGTIAVTWATQTANKVFAAPDGVTGTPAFRVMTANDIPNLPWTKITSMLPTTLLGYGITDAVRNVGGTPSIESGLNAAKGAGTTAGRVWISTDTREIYRDNGTTWDLIGTSSTADATKLPLAGGTMTGPLVNNSNSALTAVAVTQSGAGYAATFTGGNVGIGTAAPSTVLDINGAATFRATAAPAAALTQGKIYFDTVTNKFKVSENNGAFVDLIGGGGTVTSVSSSNSYLTVTTGTTTPSLAVNVGVVANTVAAGDDSRITGALPAATAFAGDVSGVYSATSVDKIKGTGVAITTITSGNFLKYNGTNWVNSNLAAGDITGALTYTPVNKAGDTMTGLLVLSADPSANLGASTKQYVDAVTTSSNSNFVRKDGTSALSADWDVDGAGAGTRSITGLAAPTVGDGAATKTYADTKFITKTLPAAPAVGQNGQSLRWNSGSNVWEYYTAGTGSGDFMASGAVPMTGPLVNNSNSASSAVAVTQSGAGPAATFMGGNVGIGTTTPTNKLEVAGNTLLSGDLSIASSSPWGPSNWTNSTVTAITGTRNYIALNNDVKIPGTLAVGAAQWANDSGTAALYVNGNVGIGTTTPSAPLHVTKSVAGPLVKLNNSAAWTGTEFALDVTGYTNLGGFRVNGADPVNSFYASGTDVGFTVDLTKAMTFGHWNGVSKVEAMRVHTNGNIGIGTNAPSTTLDINGAATFRATTAPAAVAAQGKLYFDTTANKFKVSENNGAFVDLIPAGGGVGGTGTTNAIPKFTAAGTIGDSAIVDDGNVITASRAIASITNPIPTGASINLGLSNSHTLASVGGSTITVSGMQDGGVYNVVIEDTTVRTYTFAGCTAAYFKPANGPTQTGTRTIYGLMTVKKGANWDCYITWSSGFQ